MEHTWDLAKLELQAGRGKDWFTVNSWREIKTWVQAEAMKEGKKDSHFKALSCGGLL